MLIGHGVPHGKDSSNMNVGDSEGQLMLTVPEVARLLRISRGTAYQAVRTGQLPSIRLGRVIRVPRYALEKILTGGGMLTGLISTEATVRHDYEKGEE